MMFEPQQRNKSGAQEKISGEQGRSMAAPRGKASHSRSGELGVGSSEPGLDGQEEVALKKAPLLVDPKGGLGMVWGLQDGVGEPWNMRLGSGRSCFK